MKAIRNFRRGNARGFSLLEVMMAVGVAGILTYVIAQMMVNSGKQAASVTSKTDFNSFVNELQGVFNNTGTCISAFNGKNGTVFDVTPFNATLKVGTLNYTVGTAFGGPGGATQASNRAMKITKLQISGITPTTSTVNCPASGSSPPPCTGQFVVPVFLEATRGNPNGASKEDQTAVGGNILSKTFNVIVTANVKNIAGKNTYSIEACQGQYTDFWATTGNGSDIIYTGGNVGIGKSSTVDPPNAMLDVEGMVQAKMFMYRSDARMKENVREIPNSLDRVLKLHGVRFDWKDETLGKDQLGFLAQEVESVFPEAVSTGQGNGMKSVGYGNLLAPLVEAFKQQQELLDRNEREIAELKQLAGKKR